MEWTDAVRAQLGALPVLVKFAIAAAVIVGAPAMARRAKIPEMIGLLLFGVLLGPHVLDLGSVRN